MSADLVVTPIHLDDLASPPHCDWCDRPIDDDHPGIWNEPHRVLNMDLGSSHSWTRSHIELTFYRAAAPDADSIDLERVQLHAVCVAEIGDTITTYFAIKA